MSFNKFFNEDGKLVHYMYATDVAAREVDVYTVEEKTNTNCFICTVSFPDAKTEKDYMMHLRQLQIDMDNGHEIEEITGAVTLN